MTIHDPLFSHTLELIEHVHRLTAKQARAIFLTIPDECRLTPTSVIEQLSGRAITDFDRLTAALLVNARQLRRGVAELLELQADLVDIVCIA